jgi:hypothetical protein
MTFVMNENPEPDEDKQPEQAAGQLNDARRSTTEREPVPTPPSTPAVPARHTQPTPTPSGSIAPVPPPQARREGTGRGGCLLPWLLIGIIVIALVIVGLLLPPFSLLDRFGGTQYAALNAETPGVSHPDGLTLTIDPAQPGEGFGVVLDSVQQADFASGSANADLTTANSALPPALQMVSPIYSIDYEGTPPGAIALRVDTPANAEPYDTLDLYTWDADDLAWEFVPSQMAEGDTALVTDLNYVPTTLAAFQTGAPAAITAVPLDVTEALPGDVAGMASIVMPTGLQPTLQGTLQGSLASNFQANAGYAVFLNIRNFSDPNAVDINTVEALLSNEGLLAEHISQITACAQSCFQGTPVDGIAIDYRGIDPTFREQFSLFVRELARSLHANGASLMVIVPAAEEGGSGQPWDTGAYNWRAIGRYADMVQVVLGNDPADFATGGLVERMLRWGVGEVSRYKLLINISAQSFRQVGTDAPSLAPINFEDAVAALGDVDVLTTSDAHYFAPGTVIEATLDGETATTGFDEATQTPYIDYADGGRVWLTTRAALLYRMSVIKPFNVGGVAIRDLLGSDIGADTAQALSDFVLNSPATDGQVDLALHWTVQASSGAIVAENTTGVGEAFQWEAVPDDGNYAINVAVVSGGQESARAGQQVAVANATSTPRPTDTPPPPPPPPPPLSSRRRHTR